MSPGSCRNWLPGPVCIQRSCCCWSSVPWVQHGPCLKEAATKIGKGRAKYGDLWDFKKHLFFSPVYLMSYFFQVVLLKQSPPKALQITKMPQLSTSIRHPMWHPGHCSVRHGFANWGSSKCSEGPWPKEFQAFGLPFEANCERPSCKQGSLEGKSPALWKMFETLTNHMKPRLGKDLSKENGSFMSCFPCGIFTPLRGKVCPHRNETVYLAAFFGIKLLWCPGWVGPMDGVSLQLLLCGCFAIESMTAT